MLLGQEFSSLFSILCRVFLDVKMSQIGLHFAPRGCCYCIFNKQFCSQASCLCLKWEISTHLGGVARGGVRRSRLGGVRLSLVLRPPSTDLLTPASHLILSSNKYLRVPGPNSAVTGFFSVAESLLFWFLRAVLKLSSLAMSVLISLRSTHY